MDKHYAAIRALYGTRTAARSGVLLIRHIDEGLSILQAIGSTTRAMAAFCVHPLLQDDVSLQASLEEGSVFMRHGVDPEIVVLAMEYRQVANAYLSHHYHGADDRITLSCLPEVNAMLVADKVQNRKDFELYHWGSHPNSTVLENYFANWLRRLNITEARYQELLALLDKQTIGQEFVFDTEATSGGVGSIE